MDSIIETRDAVCEQHGAFESRSLRLLGKHLKWSNCPECERLQAEKDAADRRIAEESERQKRAEAQLKRAGIPQRFRSRSLENFVAKTPEQQAALMVAAEFSDCFADRLSAGSTLIFSGKPGTGKSHLAIGIARHVMTQGYTAMYVNALDAIRMIRATWRRDSQTTEAEVMDTLTSIDLLILDEIGMQYGTEGEQVVLFDIINRRYQDQMPVILLTNQGKAGLKEYLGDRAFDRLREDGRWVPFEWESYRGSDK